MSILIKGIPLAGYEISIMKDGERYRARVDGIWCEVEEIPTTEPDTDTIDRQAAIDALRKMQTYKLFSGDDMLLIDQAGAQTELMMLPPAQPERIKGHWIKISPANIYECSDCGKNVMTDDICAYDFCHGCGAEMEVTT